MILQRVIPKIAPLGVGYANRPKRRQTGGYVACSHIYGPAWISSNNLGEVIYIFESPRLEKACISGLCPSPLESPPPPPKDTQMG